MTYSLITLKTDGTQTVETFAKSPSLEASQKAVGGYIETVPYLTRYKGRACTAFCNEEGKLHGLPVNGQATALWADQAQTRGRALRDVLVGDIAIIQKDA